jgi:hypothetical protein
MLRACLDGTKLVTGTAAGSSACDMFRAAAFATYWSVFTGLSGLQCQTKSVSRWKLELSLGLLLRYVDQGSKVPATSAGTAVQLYRLGILPVPYLLYRLWGRPAAYFSKRNLERIPNMFSSRYVFDHAHVIASTKTKSNKRST